MCVFIVLYSPASWPGLLFFISSCSDSDQVSLYAYHPIPWPMSAQLAEGCTFEPQLMSGSFCKIVRRHALRHILGQAHQGDVARIILERQCLESNGSERYPYIRTCIHTFKLINLPLSLSLFISLPPSLSLSIYIYIYIYIVFHGNA